MLNYNLIIIYLNNICIFGEQLKQIGIMENLRNQYYNEIEVLTKKLQSFDTDQYGKSYSNESFNISNRIDELEELISNTWVN